MHGRPKPHFPHGQTPRGPRSSDPTLSTARFWTLAIAVICVAGGSNWVVPEGRLVAESLGAMLLFAAFWQAAPADRGRSPADWIVAALVLLFVAHAVPLPPALWTALPGRSPLAALDVAVFGAERWRPLSISPPDTLRSALFLVPALAVYLSVRRGDARRRTMILDGLLLAGIVAIGLGLVQAAGSGIGRFYAVGDSDVPIGFFTNHNHQALFVLAMIPLVAARIEGIAARGASPDVSATGARAPIPPRGVSRGPSPLAWLGGASALASVVVLLTASRMGLALLLPVLLATVLAFTRGDLARWSGRWSARARWGAVGAVAGVLVLVLLAASYSGGALGGAMQRTALASDQRFAFWPIVVQAAGHYLPVGSGIGTFLPAYQMVEPQSALAPLFVIHAHSDYLEIALEAGIPGILLCVAGLGWLAVSGWRAARSFSGFGAERGYAVIVMAAIAVHSLVDFPLRTIAVSCLFAACAAIVASPRSGPNHAALQS